MSLWAMLIPGLMIAVMTGLFLWGLYTVYLWRRARSWEPVPCTIVSFESKSYEVETKSSSGFKRKETRYKFKVKYRYAFAGSEFESTRFDVLTSEQSSLPYSDATAFERLFKVGSTSTCFVNPAKPATAILQRRFPFLAWVLLLVPVFVSVAISASVYDGYEPPSDAIVLQEEVQAAAAAAPAEEGGEYCEAPPPVVEKE